MNRARVTHVVSAILAAAAVSGVLAPSAPAQQRQANASQNQQGSQRTGPAIPQDTRVGLPADSRVPLGAGTLQGPPQAPARGQPAQTPQRGPSGPTGTAGGIDCPPTVTPPPYGPRYGPVYGPVYGGYPGYRRYGYNRVYSDGPYYPPYGDEAPVDTGPADAGPVDNGRAEPPARGARDAGPGAAVPDNPPGLSDLPPDELLGGQELTPALKQALDASPEYKQATADLIRAWSAYAGAVDAVLGDVKNKPEYRRAQAEMRKARARLDAVQTAGRGADAKGDAPADRLLAAADAALKARRSLRQLESAAVGADSDVRRARLRLDDVIAHRDQVRDKIVANLAPADRPAAPKRPKLLEGEE